MKTALNKCSFRAKGYDPDIEVTVKMFNVNYGKNQELLENCKALGEYAWLVAKIREIKSKNGNEDTDSVIDKAITALPNDFVIRSFLLEHRAEVKGMLLTEYNEAEAMELFKEDGRKEGRKEGIWEILISLVKDGLLSIKDAAARAGVSESIFEQKMTEKLN